MKQLNSRVSKIEREVYRVEGIKTFLKIVCSAVTQADPEGGKKLTQLLAAREGEFIRDPSKMNAFLVDFLKHLDSDGRDKTIEILMSLRDGLKGDAK